MKIIDVTTTSSKEIIRRSDLASYAELSPVGGQVFTTDQQFNTLVNVRGLLDLDGALNLGTDYQATDVTLTADSATFQSLTAGGVVVTLPPAVEGLLFIISKRDTGTTPSTVRSFPVGGDLIDGAASVALTYTNDTVWLLGISGVGYKVVSTYSVRPPLGAGGLPLTSYRGVWSGANQYYAGDIVMSDGKLYETSTDQAPLGAVTFVGQAGAYNLATKTSSTTLPLPSGAQVGDTLLALIHVDAATNTAATTSWYTAPSWGTSVTGTQVHVFGTNINTNSIWEVRSYALTSGDITTGSLTIPTQSNANLGSLAQMYVNALGFRGSATVENYAIGTTATGTSVTPSATTGSLASTTSAFTVYGLVFGGTIINTSSQAFSPDAVTNSYVQQTVVGTGSSARGGTVVGYRTSGTVVGAESISGTFASSTAWSARAVAVTIGATTSFNPANWNSLTPKMASGSDNGQGAAGNGLMTYRGVFSPTTAYYAGDVVSYQGALYSTAVSQAVGSTYVGQSGASNDSAKTTTTNVTLPVGAAAGDFAVLAVDLNPVVTTPTTAMYTAPSFGTAIVAANAFTSAATTTTGGVIEMRGYTLTSTDITNGFIQFPAQSNASNASTATLNVVALVFRGVAAESGTVTAAVASGTGTTSTAIAPAISATQAVYVVHALAIGSLEAPTSATFSPDAILARTIQQVSTGTVRATMVAGYRAHSATSVNAETVSATGASSSWAAKAATVTLTSTAFSSANWSLIGLSGGGTTGATQIADWNYATTAGVYSANNAANGPNVSATYLGLVMKDPGIGAVTQVLWRASNTDAPEMWTRQRTSGGVWQTWYQLHGDSGWITTGMTHASDGTITSQRYRVIGKEVEFYVTGTLGTTIAASITGGTSVNGDYTNTAVVTLPAAMTPTQGNAAVSAGGSGPAFVYNVTSAGTLFICSGPVTTGGGGTASFTTSTGFSAGGRYRID